MRIDVIVEGSGSIEGIQKDALIIADRALGAAFYRMEDRAEWLQLIEVLVRDTPHVILSRISLEGRNGRFLRTVADQVAWVTGAGRLRPNSAKTPISRPWEVPQ